MANRNNLAWSSPPQERKYRRFQLQYPVRLKVHDVDLMVEFEAASKNISIRGLLVETRALVPQHTPVSFVVTVPAFEIGRPIQFVGEGKVVRVNSKPGWSAFAIAVECSRPIAEMDDCLETTGT